MDRGRDWIFIINPTAGKRKSVKSDVFIRNMISNYFPHALVTQTRSKGHATRLASYALDKGYTHFISVGGDGTLHEVLQAVAGKKGVVLGVVPVGSGNDYASVLGLPDVRQEVFWNNLLQCPVKKADLGLCNDVYFINGVGIGFDAEVATGVQRKALLKGKARYWSVIIRNLLFYKSNRMELESGNNISKYENFLSTIAIGRKFGGGFPLTPRAMADDGLLDLCVVRDIPVFKRVNRLLALQKGEHLNAPEVDYFQVPEVTLVYNKPIPAHLDGEIVSHQKFHIKVLKKQLDVIYYPEGKHYFLPEGG